MKIGILTFHTPCNFGANLQAYTSSKYFESLGHEVKIINYVDQQELSSYSNQTEQFAAHWNFSQKVLKVTPLVSNAGEVYQIIKDEQIDIVVIGADAVWSKKNRKRLEVFYANWLWGTELENKVKVITMSPAFMGSDYRDLTEEERNSFKNALLKFHSVNVRDNWTKEVINRDIMGFDFIQTINPDPVFLLNSFCNTSWSCNNYKVKSKNYYVITLPKDYFQALGGIKKLWLRRLKKELNSRGYLMVELPIPDGYSGFKEFDYIVEYPIDPLQWYLWLKNAKGFIGLRFHAVVSCFSAGTPFYSLDSYASLPKWQHYLNLLGYHGKDREWAYKSKIRNLLEGSGFETFRRNNGQIYTESPKTIVDKLENVKQENLLSFRDKMISKFKENMYRALKTIDDETCNTNN